MGKDVGLDGTEDDFATALFGETEDAGGDGREGDGVEVVLIC